MQYNAIMWIKTAFGGLLLLTNLVFTSLAFAGGGPVEFTIDPNQALNPGEQYIVHARVWADGSFVVEPYPAYCKNCFIKLALQNPQDGDYIAQNDNVTNDEGRIYAKVISKVPGNRTIYVSELRNIDGTRIPAYSTVVLPYTGEPISIPTPNPTPTPAPQPTIPPSGNIYVKVGVQRYVEGPKRYVYLSWSKVEGAIKYNLYARLSDMKDYGAAIVGTGSLSTEIGINAFLDYYVKVDACNSAGCITSSEVFVPRMKQEEGGTVVAPSPSTVTPTPSSNNSNIEDLNKKVENLQNQLEESKQRQSFLETRINQLVSWIKSVFPFFK